jgi:endonuclease III
VPTIIVLSNKTANRDSAVVLSENVQPEHMASDHHAAQLIERLGWAVSDAKEAEVEEESGR